MSDLAESGILPSTSLTVGAGLLGGFAAGRLAGRPMVADAVVGGIGVLVGMQWLHNRGPATAAVLGGVYVGAMGLTHAMVSRRFVSIPVVALASVAAALASYALHDKYVTIGLDPAEQP